MEYLDKVVSGKCTKFSVLNQSMWGCISIPYIPVLILFLLGEA
jgi:hypothetical protein